MSVYLGEEVGYMVWFEDVILEKIWVKYMIDGMFLREVIGDFLFFRYVVVILDEVYERIVYIDVFFGVVKVV